MDSERLFEIGVYKVKIVEHWTELVLTLLMKEKNFHEFVELNEKNDISSWKVIKPKEQKM